MIKTIVASNGNLIIFFLSYPQRNNENTTPKVFGVILYQTSQCSVNINLVLVFINY